MYLTALFTGRIAQFFMFRKARAEQQTFGTSQLEIDDRTGLAEMKDRFWRHGRQERIKAETLAIWELETTKRELSFEYTVELLVVSL